LFEFRSFVEAVRCAVAVQNSIAECFSAAPPERRIVFRIGIYVGDVVEISPRDWSGLLSPAARRALFPPRTKDGGRGSWVMRPAGT
jgi:hypothetical protein